MSDFIPLKVNEQINYTKGVNAMAMFDENKNLYLVLVLQEQVIQINMQRI